MSDAEAKILIVSGCVVGMLFCLGVFWNDFPALRKFVAGMLRRIFP